MSTYKDLIAQRDALNVSIEEAKSTESVEAIDTVRRLIYDFGLTSADCGFHAGPTRAIVTPINTRTPAPIKYLGLNGETWSGRGKPPRWIVAYEAQGGQRADCLVTVA